MATAVAGCVGEDAPPDDDADDDGKGDGSSRSIDVQHTDLVVDLTHRTGTATLSIAGRGNVALEAAGLEVVGVRDWRGDREFKVSRGRLRISDVAGEVTVDYAFSEHHMADGQLPGGSTVTWPYFCGNLFPCDSRPADGTQFSLALEGVPTGKAAIYPRRIDADAPPYMLAWAVGDYASQDLGTTSAGTKINVSWLPRGKTAALDGTRHLVAAFDWLETHIGPYLFGDQVGSVAVVWGEGMYGGMEHHPLWHVAVDAMADEETHVHEAAHGWFGNGVRLRCWEDFVLSEGTVSYLAARALGATAGAAAETEVWRGYQDALDAELAEGNRVSWPRGCGEVDILRDGLFSNLPYMEGAFFYKAVADQVGVEVLDGVISRFYMEHRAKPAGMQEMIDAIEADTGFDPAALVKKWLR